MNGSELEGRTVLVTRAADQGQDLCRQLEAAGARAIHIPTIAIADPEDWTPVDEAISRLGGYHWLILTSANAVDQFFSRAGGAVGSSAVKIAVVGRPTADRLAGHGIEADLVPSHYRAEFILDVLPLDLTGVRVLFPRAEVAGERLPETLRERGAEVDVVTVYRTVVPGEGADRLRSLFEKREIDCVTFTSGSTAQNLMTMLGGDALELLKNVNIAVMGPVTWEAVRGLGLEVAIESPTAKISILVDAIRAHYAP